MPSFHSATDSVLTMPLVKASSPFYRCRDRGPGWYSNLLQVALLLSGGVRVDPRL